MTFKVTKTIKSPFVRFEDIPPNDCYMTECGLVYRKYTESLALCISEGNVGFGDARFEKPKPNLKVRPVFVELIISDYRGVNVV